MNLTLVFYLAIAEVLRRYIVNVMFALTGPLSKIPGPFISKLTGLPWAFQTITGRHIYTTEQLLQTYGDIVRVGPNSVVVADKAGIHKILVEEDLMKPPFLDNIRLHPSNSILLTERDKVAHKHARRLLSPGFSISYLNGLEPLMQECVQEFEKFLDLECEKSNGTAVINMEGTLGNLAFDVMSATSLGGSFNLVASNNNKIKKSFMSMMMRVAVNAKFPYLRYIPFWPEMVSAETNKMLDNVINRREKIGRPAKKDLVQIILDAHETDPVRFPELRMRDEILMFMVAGTETTSENTTAILLGLLNNPKTLERLIDEIDSTFPSIDDDITFAELQELPYLNAVIWEGMRVMAATAGLSRYTTESIIIGGYEIPPETVVYPWPIAVMKDSRIWPDAASFVPERWLGSYKGVEANPKDILVFSAGSRNCLGWQFAMREMRLILAKLIRRYELSLVPGQSHERRYHAGPWFVQGFYKVGVKARNSVTISKN